LAMVGFAIITLFMVSLIIVGFAIISLAILNFS
jgi:hypothetical protein